MKVLRYSAVAAVAIFAAACGDKVTVAGPTAVTLTTTTTTTTTPVAPGKINSIAVAPAAVTLTIGQAVTLVAAVNADLGVATTVTWSSSDATKASVSTAGLVTALAATPGVAICATSTVNVGVKGCASAVVVAASATVPATATIQGVYAGTTATPITPSNVSLLVPVLVNVDPGTETLTKIYLKIGTVIADSQVFSAAQSAALRNAVETANETGAQAAGVDMGNALQSIMLTANTAAYNATTGAVSFANGSAALTVELYVAGTTTARSTAKYSTSLTLNNADAVYGAWTLPSTKVQALDASGYQWTSLAGGAMTLEVMPVLYSGKTATSATVKYTNHRPTAKVSCASRVNTVGISTTGLCFSTTTFGDTNSVRTITTFPGTASFNLWDRDMTRGGSDANVIAPPVPTFTLTLSDGSTLNNADANMTAKTGTSLALRIDNAAPTAVTANAKPERGTAGFYRSTATFVQRPSAMSTDADSSKLITAISINSDSGVSSSPVYNGDLKGITWTVYASAGTAGTSDSGTVTTTAITGTSGLTTGYAYCFQVRTFDKLMNGQLYPDQSVVTAAASPVATTCPIFGGQTRSNVIDNTAPVLAWATTNYSSSDTAVTTVPINSDYKYVVTEANGMATSALVQGVQVRACYYSTSSNAVVTAIYNSLGTTTTSTCDTYVAQATYVGVTNQISTAAVKFAEAAISDMGTYVLMVKGQDKAGNDATAITRYVVVDNTNPTVSAPSGNTGLLGTAAAPAAYIADNVDVRSGALTTGLVTAYSSNSVITLNPVVNSAGTRIAPVLEDNTTLINSALGAMAASRFFNVSFTGASSIQYLAPMAVSGDTLILGAGAASVPSANEATLLGNTFRTSYAVRAYDQVGNTVLSAYAPGSITDSIVTANAASRFVVVNGLISGIDATTVDAGTSGTASGVVNVATTAALAAANATYTTTKALTLTLKQYSYEDRLQGLLVRSLTYRQANNYCASGLAASTVQVVNAAGAESLMAAASTAVPSRMPKATAAPTVYVYAPLVGAASWGLVGTMTNSNSVSALNTVGVCDDTITRTYTYTWNVSTRLPATNWSNGQLQYVVLGQQGQATMIKGPYVLMVK